MTRNRERGLRKTLGTTIGYVSMGVDEQIARFEYDPNFVAFGIEFAPLLMPLRPDTYIECTHCTSRSELGAIGAWPAPWVAASLSTAITRLQKSGRSHDGMPAAE